MGFYGRTEAGKERKTRKKAKIRGRTTGRDNKGPKETK